MADTSYDAQTVLERIAALGARTVIPSKPNCRKPRTLDKHQYENRNVIERCFCASSISRRYEKLASRFSSFIALVATVIWLQ